MCLIAVCFVRALLKSSIFILSSLPFKKNRIVNHWNSLPNSVVTAPTIATFKQRLDDLAHSKACGLALAN